MLSTSESDTLKSICDTFFPAIEGGSEFYRRSASEMSVDSVMAESIQNSLQPSSSRDFKRALAVVESPLYNLILTGRATRFSSLSLKEREDYLSRWRDSRIPLKRTAFQAFKRLSCFIAYSLADSSGRNPNWPFIDYPGPSYDQPVPVSDDLRIHPVTLEKDETMNCDVVVIGSGAGGGVIADRLAGEGYDVMVVEQGPYETAETFKQNELTMMQKLFQQSGTASTKDLSFVLLAGRGAGGGTTVNWNTCLRPPARVLKEWENDFGIEDVSGSEFALYLDEVWGGIRVSSKESQRNRNNSVLWEGCKALGYREGTDYHEIERNAVGCEQRCDFCTYGCIYSCKQSTALTYLPSAQKKGARFLFDTRAERIRISEGRATGVECVQSSLGKQSHVTINSRVVVAACGGIETPALLLRSGISDKNVGRYLRLDPTVAVGGIFDDPVEAWKGPPQTVAVWKFIDLDGTYHGFWIEAAPAHPGLFALSIPWANGRQHKEFMQKYYPRSSASIVLLRERSSGQVKVDRYGYPAVTYDLGRKDKETLVTGMKETAKILAAAGATGVWTTHSDPVSVGDGKAKLTSADLDRFEDELERRGVVYNRLMLFSAHLMGSCRMSKDPSLGPTAPTGELHSLKNLFIGDACVFPTTPAVNPMISIMAMARRTSESIISALKSAG